MRIYCELNNGGRIAVVDDRVQINLGKRRTLPPDNSIWLEGEALRALRDACSEALRNTGLESIVTAEMRRPKP